jgi:hypothetical protein
MSDQELMQVVSEMIERDEYTRFIVDEESKQLFIIYINPESDANGDYYVEVFTGFNYKHNMVNIGNPFNAK